MFKQLINHFTGVVKSMNLGLLSYYKGFGTDVCFYFLKDVNMIFSLIHSECHICDIQPGSF